MMTTDSVAPGQGSPPDPSPRKHEGTAKQHLPARLPTVNLLSPSVFEQRALRRLRLRLALVAIALVVLMSAGRSVQNDRIAHAEQELAVQQVRTNTLTAQVKELAPVRQFYATVAQRKSMATRTMATEVMFSQIMDELRARTPPGLLFETMSVKIQPAGTAGGAASGSTAPASPAAPATGGTGSGSPAADATGCPTPDPFTATAAVGCIIIGGTAADREALGWLVILLGESKLFVGPFVSTSTVSAEGLVAFTGTVALSQKVFSGRYADLGWTTTAQGAR
jgi:hypothetical protein